MKPGMVTKWNQMDY